MLSNPPIPIREPETFTPGDTLIFTIAEKKYDSRLNWNLVYSFRGDSVINFSSTPDSITAGSHAVNVAAATTKTWIAGTYFFQCQAVNSATGETHTLRKGRMEFLKNYSALSDQGFTDYSPAEIALQNLLAFDGAVADGIDPKNIDPTVYRYQIDGVEIIRFMPEERIKLIEKYQRIVAREKRASQLASGRKPHNKVLIKFKR